MLCCCCCCPPPLCKHKGASQSWTNTLTHTHSTHLSSSMVCSLSTACTLLASNSGDLGRSKQIRARDSAWLQHSDAFPSLPLPPSHYSSSSSNSSTPYPELPAAAAGPALPWLAGWLSSPLPPAFLLLLHPKPATLSPGNSSCAHLGTVHYSSPTAAFIGAELHSPGSLFCFILIYNVQPKGGLSRAAMAGGPYDLTPQKIVPPKCRTPM